MARIRTIKPEFPHSESMGRVSRDARLTFVELWTLADDAGRLRGNSRMLASLLFPYDDDAKELIDGWLSELEREKCIVRYTADGTHYVQILNWLMHQKIDKPSKSKLPEFDESSRTLANPREASSGDQDQGREGKGSIGADAPPPAKDSEEPKKRPSRRCPSDFVVTDDLKVWASTECPGIDIVAQTKAFRDYEFRNSHSDWPATWRTWMRKAHEAIRARALKQPEPRRTREFPS